MPEDGSSYKGELLDLCEKRAYTSALERVRDWDQRFPINEKNKQTATAAPTHASTPAATSKTPKTLNPSSILTAREDIRRELLRTNPSGLSCLHVLLEEPSGINNELFERLVRRYRSLGKQAVAAVFLFQDQYNYTLLHKCTMRGLRKFPQLLQMVLEACPEAQFRKNFFLHTPLEMSRTYPFETKWKKVTIILQASMQRYQTRICLQLCVGRLFLAETTQRKKRRRTTRSSCGKQHQQRKILTPFDEADRNDAGMAPGPWFVASILGFCWQRELDSLARCILSFVDNCDCWIDEDR